MYNLLRTFQLINYTTSTIKTTL